MFRKSVPGEALDRGDRDPLVDRPDDEIEAVKEAFSESNEPDREAAFGVSVMDGWVTLWERGDLATVGSDSNELTRLTKSRLWQADIETVREEIDRRSL